MINWLYKLNIVSSYQKKKLNIVPSWNIITMVNETDIYSVKTTLTAFRHVK